MGSGSEVRERKVLGDADYTIMIIFLLIMMMMVLISQGMLVIKIV